ncbi:MAG: helix-turn-helix transcriptional regulator [Actinobacteria bacterium]|nr:helix-turn-helix transcriptional regulator [Actinomycetota bacterium]
MDRPSILRDVMSRTGMTQSNLSVLSGVKQPSLSQMLHGRIVMSDDMLDRLLSCMGYRLEVVRRPVPVSLDHSSERRWRMHQPLVSQLSPDSLRYWGPVLTRNLERLRRSTRGDPHTRNIDRWGDLVSSGDIRGIRRVMTGLDTDSIQMREVSPFGGLLPDGERKRVLTDVQH